MKKIYDFSHDDLSAFWKEGSGNNVRSLSHSFFPESILEEFSLNLDVRFKDLGDIVINTSHYVIAIYRHGITAISRIFEGNEISQSLDLIFDANGVNRLKIAYSKSQIQIILNGNQIVFNCDYIPKVTRLEIVLRGESEIVDLELLVEKLSLDLNPANSFGITTTIDFYDDIIPEPFTEEMLDLAFKKMIGLGIKKVYWIYWGNKGSGFWRNTGMKSFGDHIDRTFANLGDNLLKKVTEIAHRNGLQMYAIIKPFDMHILGSTFPEGSDLANKYGKYDILGGRGYFCFDYIAQHPELCMQRKPVPEKDTAISRIEINLINKVLPEVDVRLWSSANNGKYEIYDGKVTVGKAPGKIVIDGINNKNKYWVVELLGDCQNGNIVRELVRAFDSNGEPVDCTLGLKQREIRDLDSEAHHLERESKGDSFVDVGIDFDGLRICVPSGILCGDAAGNYYRRFDAKNNFLGIAVGHNEFVPGAMSPSEPKARQYWLKLIQETLDSGVDGVDVRVSSHLDILEWGEYGFNAPIVNEFKKMYGVNILESGFDKSLLRKLRGSFYTEFLKEAACSVRRYNKKFQFHIEDVMNCSPDKSTMMEIYWDWEKWIEYIRPDEVTFKAISSESYNSEFALKVIEKCRYYGIPIDYSTFTHCVADVENYCISLQKMGFSNFNLYEFASYYKAKNGDFIEFEPNIIRDIKKLNKRNIDQGCCCE